MNLREKWVLITGASSGLGHAIGRVMARDYGANLILAARRTEKLLDLADGVESTYGVRTIVCPTDLTKEEDVQRLFETSTRSQPLQAAVLNAGFTYYGRHLEIPQGESQTLIETNTTSLVRLTDLLLPHLIRQSTGGGLMLVSSLAAFAPVPYQAIYSGSKAFVAAFGAALREETRSSGVSITVFAPGGIATEALDKSGLAQKFSANHPAIMSADRCAALGVRAFVRRKGLYVPGALNRVSYMATRMIPQGLLLRSAERLYRKD